MMFTENEDKMITSSASDNTIKIFDVSNFDLMSMIRL